MKKSSHAYRFVTWGMLGAFGIYTGLMVYDSRVLTYGSLAEFLKALLIPGAIMAAEFGVYWLIRKRLYYKWCVYIHIGSIWVCIVVIPAFYFLAMELYSGSNDPAGFMIFLRYVGKITSNGFLGSLVIGHLFFILTIVKSFSKKKKLQTTDATDTPHILDEFNQQSAGL
jgi:hypothetical protein